MKALFAIAMLVVGLATPSNAGVLAGPVTCPVNGHAYYLLECDTWRRPKLKRSRSAVNAMEMLW